MTTEQTAYGMPYPNPDEKVRDVAAHIEALAQAANDKLIPRTKGIIHTGSGALSQRLVSCALRRVSSTVWETINDSAHKPIGVLSVSIFSAQRIRVTYDFTAAFVGSVQVTPDEAFAAQQLRVGASVGLTFTDIYSYLPGGTPSTPVDPGALSTAGGNLWFTALMWVDAANQGI